MTTINIEMINEQARFHSDLPKALFGVFGQGLNSEVASTLDSFYNDKVGRAVLRNRNGAGAQKVEQVAIAVEELTGEKSYARPNGDAYYSRKWGNHSDVEALRQSRANLFYTMLYGAPGCGKTALVEAAFGEDLYTILGSGDT